MKTKLNKGWRGTRVCDLSSQLYASLEDKLRHIQHFLVYFDTFSKCLTKEDGEEGLRVDHRRRMTARVSVG